MSSSYNIPNFTNPLTSNIENGNETFIFNKSISQPDRLNFVETTKKNMITTKNYTH